MLAYITRNLLAEHKSIPRCPHCLGDDHMGPNCPLNPNPVVLRWVQDPITCGPTKPPAHHSQPFRTMLQLQSKLVSVHSLPLPALLQSVWRPASGSILPTGSSKTGHRGSHPELQCSLWGAKALPPLRTGPPLGNWH